jgi:phosphonate transport system substrate-binding protein
MKKIALYAFCLTSLTAGAQTTKTDLQKKSSLSEIKEIVIALKPDKNPDQMISERKALETELSKSLNHKVKVIIPTSSAVILQGFANGTIDLGYLSSLDMVNAENAKAAELLLVGRINGKTSYESMWLVKAESKYSSVKDLKNKPVAFASRTSTSGYLIPYWNLIKLSLLQEKQDPATYFGSGNVWYGSGYVTAVQRVLDGTAEAAAVSDYVFDQDKHLTADQKSKLKILQRQGPVPTHVIAARKSLSPDQMLELKKALLQFGKINIELRDKVFSSEIIDSKSLNHLASTREALSLTGLTIETK